MRIMLDTNVLVSALLFPGPKMNILMRKILTEHKLVLSSYVVDELKLVVQRKFPTKLYAVEELLAALNFEYVYTPAHIDLNLFSIRDCKDYPVLYTAVTEAVDVMITGDKDFADVDIDFPEVMTPAEFIDKY